MQGGNNKLESSRLLPALNRERLHGLAGLPAMASQLPNQSALLLSAGSSSSNNNRSHQQQQNQMPLLSGGKPTSMASLQAASAAAFPPLTMAGTSWGSSSVVDQFETAASAFLAGPLNMWDKSSATHNILGGLSANQFDLQMSGLSGMAGTSSSLAAALAASAGNVNVGGNGSASGGSGSGGDFKLEYMDLDEFLCENGLASSGAASAAAAAVLGGASGPGSNGSGGGAGGGGSSSSAAAAAVAAAAAAASGLLNAAGSQPSAAAANSQALLERHLHNAVMQAATNASGGNSTSSPTSGGTIGEENKVSSTTGMKEHDSPPNQHIDMRVEFDISPADLHLASVPGEAPFDPRRRRFSEEELKPQPMIKKSKKTFVPHDAKDDKYWARRRKNNIAAKKSRDARRIKENQVSIRASYLEKENSKLRDQLERLIRDNLTMRERCRCGAAMSVKFDPNDFEIVAKRLHTPTSSPSTMSSGASTSGDRA